MEVVGLSCYCNTDKQIKVDKDFELKSQLQGIFEEASFIHYSSKNALFLLVNSYCWSQLPESRAYGYICEGYGEPSNQPQVRVMVDLVTSLKGYGGPSNQPQVRVMVDLATSLK
jgi:hypothetical protein